MSILLNIAIPIIYPLKNFDSSSGSILEEGLVRLKRCTCPARIIILASSATVLPRLNSSEWTFVSLHYHHSLSLSHTPTLTLSLIAPIDDMKNGMKTSSALVSSLHLRFSFIFHYLSFPVSFIYPFLSFNFFLSFNISFRLLHLRFSFIYRFLSFFIFLSFSILFI